MADWAQEHLLPGQTFGKGAPADWFAQRYPKIKRNTVNMHVEGMWVNNRIRRHHQNIKPGSGHDLFYKLGPDQFRLWVPESDPAPLYKDDIEKQTAAPDAESVTAEGEPEEEPGAEAAREFAFKQDLRNYLVGAVAAFAREPNGGQIVFAGALASLHRDLIIGLAARHRLPTVFTDRAFVTAGGLASYGPNRVEQYRPAAGFVDRILKGEKPADLPVHHLPSTS